jgi:hypothetical protein
MDVGTFYCDSCLCDVYAKNSRNSLRKVRACLCTSRARCFDLLFTFKYPYNRVSKSHSSADLGSGVEYHKSRSSQTWRTGESQASHCVSDSQVKPQTIGIPLCAGLPRIPPRVIEGNILGVIDVSVLTSLPRVLRSICLHDD